MPSSNAIAPASSIARFQLSTVNARLFSSKPFSFTYFRKNASANPYGSHTYKTKDLKPFRFTYLQKKGRVAPPFPRGTRPGPNILGRVSCVPCLSRLHREGVSLAQVTGHERPMRVPTPVGTNHQPKVTTHAPARRGFRSCRRVSPSDFQPPASNLQGATDHGPWATSALCESRLPSGRTTGHNSLITSPIYFSLALRGLRIVDLAHC